MRRVLALLVCLSAACSGDDDDPSVGDAGVDAGTPDATIDAGIDAASVDAGPNGEATGTLKVFVSVNFSYFPREDGGEPFESFSAFVDVRDLADQPVSDATVELTVDSVPYAGTPDTVAGRYAMAIADAGSELTISVTRGDDLLRDARIVVPAEPVVSLVPSPPQLGETNTVTWTPVENGVASVVQVFDAGSQPTSPSVQENPEDGSIELPANGIPVAGKYEIRLEREATTVLAGPQSSGKARISVGVLTSVLP